MKGLAIGTSCILAGSFAQAGSVQVAGSAGYASEWTLAGEVIQKGGAQQYAGPVTFTHAGLCTVSSLPLYSHQVPSYKIVAWILDDDPDPDISNLISLDFTGGPLTVHKPACVKVTGPAYCCAPPF